MDLSYSDEQQHLRENLSSFFSKESTPERVRAAEPSGFDPELWDKIAAMGLPAMAVPEDLGGGGASVGVLRPESGASPLHGELEHHFRSTVVGTSIYGGSSEIQREIIAEGRLGLPRNRPK